MLYITIVATIRQLSEILLKETKGMKGKEEKKKERKV
jgi:hypothetical protein